MYSFNAILILIGITVYICIIISDRVINIFFPALLKNYYYTYVAIIFPIGYIVGIRMFNYFITQNYKEYMRRQLYMISAQPLTLISQDFTFPDHRKKLEKICNQKMNECSI